MFMRVNSKCAHQARPPLGDSSPADDPPELKARAFFRTDCRTKGWSEGSWPRFNRVSVMVLWRMSYEPRNTSEEHQQHQPDEDPKLIRRVLVPLEPTQTFPRPAVNSSASWPTEVRSIR